MKDEIPVKLTEQQIGDFSFALHNLKQGLRVCRKGWNGKGMWIQLASKSRFSIKGIIDGSILNPVTKLNKIYVVHDEEYAFPLTDFILMKTVSGTYVPWLASQTDILAEDWELFKISDEKLG